MYSSVLNPQLRKLMNHDCKRHVEEYLIESGLNFTVLQPSHFMNKQVLLGVYNAPGRDEGEPAVFHANLVAGYEVQLYCTAGLGCYLLRR